MKSHFLGPFLLWLQGQGLPVEAWLTACGVDDDAIGARELDTPHGTYCRLLQVAEDATEHPALGLAFARSAPRMYALMEALWQNCPNVDAMFGTWSYYARAMSGRMTFDIQEVDGTVIVGQTCAGYDLRQERVSNEFLIAWFLRQIRTLSGAAVIPRAVSFAHAEPADVEAYVDFFGTTNLEFEAGGNRLVLDAKVKELPVALADPRVLEALMDHDRRSSPPPAPTSDDDHFVERLHGEIEVRLPSGTVQLEDIAKKLGMSVRTLQRRLAEPREASTFQREVERVRERVAKQHLLERGRTLTEVASLIGYRDATAFFRAFKRWTGRTPSEFRADHERARLSA